MFEVLFQSKLLHQKLNRLSKNVCTETVSTSSGRSISIGKIATVRSAYGATKTTKLLPKLASEVPDEVINNFAYSDSISFSTQLLLSFSSRCILFGYVFFLRLYIATESFPEFSSLSFRWHRYVLVLFQVILWISLYTYTLPIHIYKYIYAASHVRIHLN